MSSGISGISTVLLTPRPVWGSPAQGGSFGGRGLSGWRGGCASRYGEAGVGVGEDKDLWSRTALAKDAFSRQRRQNGAGERHRCGRARCSWKLNANQNPVRVDSCFV